MKILILAGGSGTRLWPLSTKKHPKQFIHLGDGESLLRKTVKRFSKQTMMNHIFIVTTQEYSSFVIEDLKDIDSAIKEKILIEPCSKNTAPAITWAIRSLLLKQLATEDELILTVPIDHVFSNDEAVIHTILQAKTSLEAKSILAFGIQCTRLESGYGYIKKGEQLSHNYHAVAQFIEKPSPFLAEQLLKEGQWLWNVGIFFFSIRTYLEGLKEVAKILYDNCDPHIPEGEYIYKTLPSISIDHAIIEKFNSLRVVEIFNTSWLDIGSWHGLHQFLQENATPNIQLGNIASRERVVLG
jgi:mannose-1-phosphate guanylyltransferase/mannose-6-phosphate isomerase